MLNQEMLKAYKKRWQRVAEVEEVERRQTSLTQRWQKMNSLFQIAATLGLKPSVGDRPTEIVSQQWNRLKMMYLSQEQKQST